MKTLNIILLMLTLSGLLVAQTDSTVTDAIDTNIEAVDTLPIEESALLAPDSPDSEQIALDSTVIDTSELAVDDSVILAEPEMIWVQKEPEPIVVAALTNLGPLYFWSNDGLSGIDFESLPYLTILDPAIIAIKAGNCNDIVCHLLASDSSGVDYVIVTPEDSSNFRIYNTITKVVDIEAPGEEIVSAFDAFLRHRSGMEQILAVIEDTTLVSLDLTEGLADGDMIELRAEAITIKRLNFRSMDELFLNPANLAREYSTFTSWNLLPDFNISVQNSLLTGGWYKEWWTTGGVWSEDRKNEYLATIIDQDFALNIAPDFQNLIGFRIGQFGFNLSGISHLKMILPGNILGLPMQDILLDESIVNAGLEIEAIPLAVKSSISYAHPISTPYGDLKVGGSVNMYGAVGFMKMSSDDFAVFETQDSMIVTATGETWYTNGGAEGHLDDPDLDNFEAGNIFSDPSIGFDLGLILDLQSYLAQEVEVQLSLRNIGAKYQWSNITHESWIFEQRMPAAGDIEADTSDAKEGLEQYEQYQTTETVLIGENEEFSIDVPTVLNLAAIYQPHTRILLGAGIEKAFTDEIRFGYSPHLEFTYQLNLYAAHWVDFSYHRQTQYGEGVHTFGTGFHFGFLDTGLSVSLFNGLNSNIKGMGLGFRSSLHF